MYGVRQDPVRSCVPNSAVPSRRLAGTLHPCDVQNVAKKERESQGENKAEAKKQRSSARRPVLNAPVTKSPGNLMPRELPVHSKPSGSSFAVRKLRVWLGVHSHSLTIDMHLVEHFSQRLGCLRVTSSYHLISPIPDQLTHLSLTQALPNTEAMCASGLGASLKVLVSQGVGRSDREALPQPAS